MTPLTQAFGATKVAFTKSMQEVEGVLSLHGIRESRFTHARPQRAPKTSFDVSQETAGYVLYEFVKGKDDDQRGVRITVRYQPRIGPKGGLTGSTAEMAGRALYWYLKGKFDAIDYGIEEFDVAFMPHLMTALGTTFAEQPSLITEVIYRPESIALIAPSTTKQLPRGN